MIDTEHEARMKEIEANHQRKMQAIEARSNFETMQHNSMMARIEEQSNIIEKTGRLDVNKFSSKMSVF